MAQNQAQEKTEQPTPKRLRESAEKGEVARSRELTTAVLLLFGTGAIYFIGAGIVEDVYRIARGALTLQRLDIMDTDVMGLSLAGAVGSMMMALSPLLIVVACTAMLAPMALNGWSFSAGALAPKWSRIDPISGMKRVFSLRGLMELGKALMKFFVVVVAAVLLLHWFTPAISFLGLEPMPRSFSHAGGLIALACIILVSPLLLVAAVDVPFQLWDHSRKLKMTKQEVKDEQKETDGNPQVKGRLRELQRKIAYGRMMSQVPDADVVITNPVHFAVALKYKQDSMSAPVVLARGADLVALQIIRTGKNNDVPIVASPPLARALFYTTELNGQIPVGLYRAVAQILAYVFQLRNAGNGNRGP